MFVLEFHVVLFAVDTTIYSRGSSTPYKAVQNGTLDFEEAKDWFEQPCLV